MKALHAAILAKLEANATILAVAGGVWRGQRPQGGVCPVVQFRKVSGTWRRDYTYGGARLVMSGLVDVKVIGVGDAADTLGDVDEAFTTALDWQALTVAGWQHMQTIRESDFEYPEVADGVTYWHVGGSFRVWLAKTA